MLDSQTVTTTEARVTVKEGRGNEEKDMIASSLWSRQPALDGN